MAVRLIPDRIEARPGESLRFTLVNRGPDHVSFGTPYGLARDHDGEWISCNVETAWTTQLIVVRPGGRHESAANIPRDALPGRYRVSKQVEHRETGRKEIVTFEFNIARAHE